MTGREKIAAALGPSGSPQTPAVICYEGIYVRDHWEQVSPDPWWYRESPAVEHQLSWRRQAIARTGQDWFALPASASRAERALVAVEPRGSAVVRVDRRTGAEEELLRPAVGGWSPVGGLHSVSPPVPAATPDEIDVLLPLPGDTGLLEDGRGELAAALLAEFGATHYPLCHVSSPLWGCYGVWGFEGLMASIAERPDVVQYACERLLVIAQQGVRQAALIGAEGVWIEECLTDQISPADYARLNLPFLGRLVEAIRRHGMQSVYYYCGDPTDRWDLLLECGADALSLEESKKGFTVDVEEVVRRVRGRCAVLGNLDAIGLLAGGTEEQLRAEVARQVEAGRRNGSRFVMSLGSPVTPDTDVERVRRYCDLVHELG